MPDGIPVDRFRFPKRNDRYKSFVSVVPQGDMMTGVVFSGLCLPPRKHRRRRVQADENCWTLFWMRLTSASKSGSAESLVAMFLHA